MADNSIIEIDMADADTGLPVNFNTARPTNNNHPESTVTATEPQGSANASASPINDNYVPTVPALEPQGSVNEPASAVNDNHVPIAPTLESASGSALAADHVHVPNIIPASNHEDPDEMSFMETHTTEFKVGTTQITRDNGTAVRHVGFQLQDDTREFWHESAPFYATWTGETTFPIGPRPLNPQTPAKSNLRPGYPTPLFNKDATLIQDMDQNTPEGRVVLSVPMQMDLDELQQTPMEYYGRESIQPALVYRTEYSHDIHNVDNFTARNPGTWQADQPAFQNMSQETPLASETKDIVREEVMAVSTRATTLRRRRAARANRVVHTPPTSSLLQSRKRKRGDDDDGIYIRRSNATTNAQRQDGSNVPTWTFSDVYGQAVANVQPLLDRALLVKRGIVAAVRMMSRLPRAVCQTAEWISHPAVYTYRALKRRRIQNTATLGQEVVSTNAVLNQQEPTLPQSSESASANNTPDSPEKKTEAQRHEDSLHNDPSPTKVEALGEALRRRMMRKHARPVHRDVQYHLAVRKELESILEWPESKSSNSSGIKKKRSSKTLSTNQQRLKNLLDGSYNYINSAEGHKRFSLVKEEQSRELTRDKEEATAKKTEKIAYLAHKAEMAKVRTLKAKRDLPPKYHHYYHEEVPHVYQSEFEDEPADEPNPDYQLRQELRAEVAKAVASREQGARVVPAPITLAPPVEQSPQPAPGKDDATEQSLPPAGSLRPLQLDPPGRAHFDGEERAAEPPMAAPEADEGGSAPEHPASPASSKEEPLAELNELAGSLDQPAPEEIPAPVAPPQLVASLSDEQTRKLAEAIGNSNPGATVGPGVTRKDIGTIVPHHSFDRASGWLNDVAVETFLQHVVAEATDRLAASSSSSAPATDDGNATDASAAGPRGRRRTRGQTPDPTPRYHAFNPAFMKSVAERGAGAVARWARRAKMGGEKVLRVRTIFFPINLSGSHWSLLLVHPQERKIQSLDSLAPEGDRRAVRLALDWLRQELGSAFKEEEWEVLGGASTQQTNGRDCGVFTCFNALAAARGAPPAA
ncbi:MAG: hypothetical protein Q9157_008656, partial [Trypethelium eluteriae]